jgi:Cytochrome c oxidase subunit IV
VSTASRVWFSLAGFLLIAGAVYGITAHEYAGAPLLLIGGATFCYLGLVGRSVVRRGGGADDGDAEAEGEPHVAPSIWPFAFSIAGVIIALGFIVSPWIFVVGVLAFAVSAVGWLRDVARGHAAPERPY